MSETPYLLCPFCGRHEPVEPINSGMEDDMNYREDDTNMISYAIVCNFTKGGCGATAGYRPTEDEATEVWNKRIGTH